MCDGVCHEMVGSFRSLSSSSCASKKVVHVVVGDHGNDPAAYHLVQHADAGWIVEADAACAVVTDV